MKRDETNSIRCTIQLLEHQAPGTLLGVENPGDILKTV